MASVVFAPVGGIYTVSQHTANLAQAAATYDLCVATDGPVIIVSASFYMATAGATFTSVQIKTNQTTSSDLMTAAEGAVANLGSQKLVVTARANPVYLATGQKLQYTIVGVTGTGSMLCTLVYAPVTPGASLV